MTERPKVVHPAPDALVVSRDATLASNFSTPRKLNGSKVEPDQLLEHLRRKLSLRDNRLVAFDDSFGSA